MNVWPFHRAPRPLPPLVSRPARSEPQLPPRAARAGMRIDYMTLAHARTVPAEGARRRLTVAAPMPGVVPDGAAVLAQDDALGGLYGFIDRMPLEFGAHWLGYPLLADLSQRPEYRRISEILAKEMTRKWIKLRSTGDRDIRDKLKRLDAALKRYRVQQHFRRLTELDGFFGSAKLYIDTGVGDDRDELATPLRRNPAKIGRGALRRLRVIEPMWTYPAEYNASDPLHPGYFAPRSWFVQGKRVHGSRLLSFVSREVPDLLKPAYSFGGLSLTQIAMPYVENWLRTRQSVSDLIHSFSVSGLKTNMQATLGDVIGAEDDSGGDQLARRMQLFNAYKDNRNTMAIDKDTEEFFNVSTPLGTLDKLQAQSQEQMASVTGIPLVVLLGITPSGLNASTDGEMRSWNAWVGANQEQFYTDNLQAVIEIVQLSEFGEIDPDISFTYEPLWEVDESQKAVIRKSDADTAMVYVNGGVIAPAEERARLASDESGIYVGLDVDDMPEPPGMDPDLGAEPDAELKPGDPSQSGTPGSPGQQRDDLSPRQPAAPVQPGAVPPREANDQRRLAGDKAFSEGDHPRGQPENAGEFAPAGGGGGGASGSQTPGQTQPSSQTPGQTAPGRQTAGQTKPAGQTEGPTASEPSRAGLLATRTDGKTRVQANGEPLPAHIQALKVPPGWQNVQFSPDPNAALLAIGRDAKNRPTAIYSEAYSAAQAAEKFSRVTALQSQFGSIVAKNDAAMASDNPRTRNVAACLDLVMKMGVRPGSETDTGAKVQAYGATTLQGRHVVQTETGVRLQFVGKKGVSIDLTVDDPTLAANLLERSKQAGPDGKIFGGINETQLLAHTKQVTGGDEFKTKDFRTRLATDTATKLVKAMPAPADEKAYKVAAMTVAKQVSAKLGNTPIMALQSYINPSVFSAWSLSK